MKITEIKEPLLKDGEFFKDKKDILAWLKKHNGMPPGALNSTLIVIDDDGKVSYTVGLKLKNVKKRLEVQFNEIGYNFSFEFSKLESLKGAPKKVGGVFDIRRCGLHSLEGGPEEVGSFDADGNPLESLKYAPRLNGKEKFASYSIFDCGLTSLAYCPEEIPGDFICTSNKITTIDDMPRKVTGSMYIDDNKITSLKGIHKRIMHIGDAIDLGSNPIKKAILGLILIDGLKTIRIDVDDDPEFKRAIIIIRTYLGKGKAGVLEAQERLMEAGLDDYAEL